MKRYSDWITRAEFARIAPTSPIQPFMLESGSRHTTLFAMLFAFKGDRDDQGNAEQLDKMNVFTGGPT